MGTMANSVYTDVMLHNAAFEDLLIYGGPGSLSHDFKIWPITFHGSRPSGPILFSCEKISLSYSESTNSTKQKVHVGSQYSKTS